MLPSNEASAIEFVAEQAAAQGITYLVASGDGGPDSCDDQTMIPTTDTPASVNVLASTPFTIAVGGTEFDDTANPSQYWKSTNGAGVESAISYIPENVWNESCTSNCGQLSIGLWSSGGGRSAIFPKPSWQAGVAGIPATNSRFVPDVAVTAAGHDAYLVCLDGSCQGTGCPPAVNQCFAGFSGTSASVQAFGGIMALVVQKTGERQGQANYVLYKLAGGEIAVFLQRVKHHYSSNRHVHFQRYDIGEHEHSRRERFHRWPRLRRDHRSRIGQCHQSRHQLGHSHLKASTTTLTLNNSNRSKHYTRTVTSCQHHGCSEGAGDGNSDRGRFADRHWLDHGVGSWQYFTLSEWFDAVSSNTTFCPVRQSRVEATA